MQTYIALLRGINVAGQKKIKMDALKSVFEHLNLLNVRTYIQSGNVLFESGETDDAALADQIERGIAEAFGFQVPVVLRTAEQLTDVVRRNPYELDGRPETDSLYVTFLQTIPSEESVASCLALRNEIDEFIIDGREVYVLIHKSYGESKFSNNFMEKKLKTVATTRNWETVNKLLGMSEQ
ncbi:DUF1697 domain-containing protein [Cohnella terricola]|uniref:DUF1697 domain-containing protein n=1 Tax=Cohnella terricola TaxID=1289167 RepID=A0A559J604_9BACL|nr:DUF1697 domain-containing protein [Cohnella terricola]TVX95320.1 DUF1697 domain-containing protein [Cohnella terricola]